jgi:2-dehydro-3-deoxygluconokinase
MGTTSNNHTRENIDGRSCVVTFGEIMMRLAPPENLRFSQARSFNVIYGGGEANVAVTLANFGHSARFVTRLPDNDLGRACRMYIAQYGVDTSAVEWGGDRLGIYFHEFGAMQRGSKVVYDRSWSSLSTIQPGMVDWDAVFKGADWFHFTGITPAVSQGAAEACLEAATKARELGLKVSCDLNFRAKLWNWGVTASEFMPQLTALTHVAVGNEEDADKVFGIKAPETDVIAGQVSSEKYRYVAEELVRRFPNLEKVAITLRGSKSASYNTWSGLYFDGQNHYTAPVYEITHMVDRVGGGDAFAGGLIHALRQFPDNPQQVIDFAVAASCLKHSIVGDFNLVSVAEVEKLMMGDASGRVAR